MVILGIGDGVDAGAALVVDDKLVAVEQQARHDQIVRSRGIPWQAMDAVLGQAGLRERDVDQIAVAGRFTPPLVVRKYPGLRRVARDAFSPAHDAQVFFQALMRGSGLGAMDADRAEEWFAQKFAQRGYEPQRVETVDIHKALANAAYRGQPDDLALTLTLHPIGDGAVFAVHRGGAGQLDRLWEQRGFSSLHVHLQRCATAMGLEPLLDDARMWALAARGEPDAELLALLDEELRVEGDKLARPNRALPPGRDAQLYTALSAAEPATAAASVLANLVGAVQELVRAHVRRLDCGVVALGGAIFDNPRLCAAVAELPEVERIWVQPEPGWSSLAMGSAMAQAGLHNRLLPMPGLGLAAEPTSCRAALDAAGLDGEPATVDRIAEVLARGGAVARFVGRAGFGRHGSGSRSVLVRADDPEAVDRVRRALSTPEETEPVAAVLRVPGDGLIHGLDKLPAAAYGVVAPRVDVRFTDRYPGVVSPDGRVHLLTLDPGPPADDTLRDIVEALYRRTRGDGGPGCAAVALFPLAEGQDPIVALPSDAVRVFRHARLDALELGPWLVEAPPAR